MMKTLEALQTAEAEHGKSLQTTRGRITIGQDVTWKGQPAVITDFALTPGVVVFLSAGGARVLCAVQDGDLALNGR